MGQFFCACHCRLFLQSLLSSLVHPYLSSCCFTAFDRFVSGRGLVLRKWTPWEGAPSVRRKYAGIQDHCHLGRWDLPFAINYCVSTVSENGLAWRCLFLDVAMPFLASSGIENEIKTCCGTGAGRIKNGSVWRARFWLCRI